MMWERILWATDFSEPAHDAGRRALTLANWCGATIDVLTVIPPDPGDLPPMLLSFVGEHGLREAERDLKHEVEAAALERLTEEAGFLLAAGRQPPLHVRSGEPADEIVALATELSADLVVMGASDHRRVKELVFGSTLDIVTRRAPCPVLVVR